MQGARVSVADDGISAMKVLGESSFDLILTDLHMPKMDGIELTKTLRLWIITCRFLTHGGLW